MPFTLKLRIFAHQKTTVKRVKRQATFRENICHVYISNIGFVLRIYKEFHQINKKKVLYVTLKMDKRKTCTGTLQKILKYP